MILNVKDNLRLVVVAVLMSTATLSSASEWTGYSAAEYRYFQHQSPYSGPGQSDLSLVLAPEFYHQWDQGQQSVIIAPFLRLDNSDAKRSHVDLREASWLLAKDDWELQLGIGKVYWGVTESQHLVDVINQTDLVENSDSEDKLGQPMINLNLFQDWGTVELFVLPYFRERTFAGKNGRLRGELLVDSEHSQYESAAKQSHIDVAIRWSHSIDNWDIALSHFKGTNRQPLFRLNQNFDGLIPYYEIMDQSGVEIQNTHDAWLWKLEAIRRETASETFSALTAGFEYTFYGIFDSDLDLGLISEYLFDDRHDELLSPFQNDMMIGARVTWNDVESTELLIGLIQDLEVSDISWSIEASRRLGQRWKLSLEARIFSISQQQTALYSIRNDDYIQVELARYF